MFTGIIVAVGHIRAIEQRGGDVRLTVNTGAMSLADAQLGDSIAVNGVCLTAVSLGGDFFSADVSRETLSRTTLGDLKNGSSVNLEPALQPNSRLGGHIVSGHVDGLGRVIDRHEDARSVRFKIQAPDALAKYIAEKGSICINGISLTVNSVSGAQFDINIIPHTLSETTLESTKVGDPVNLEVDLLARYIERLMLGEKAAEPAGLTESLLLNSGFIR